VRNASFGHQGNCHSKKNEAAAARQYAVGTKKGINHCTIINDSYSADLNSLHIALDFLKQMGGASKALSSFQIFFKQG
jgi:UDP-N-acetylmuramyl pentapeptide synthase